MDKDLMKDLSPSFAVVGIATIVILTGITALLEYFDINYTLREIFEMING